MFGTLFDFDSLAGAKVVFRRPLQQENVAAEHFLNP
jgi:hypothetical protein